MNLIELFETQKALDVHILLEKGLMGHQLLEEKVLGLQTEFGELANELPEVFKYWSSKENDYEKALVEYVDCLHLILSIGIELGLDDRGYTPNEDYCEIARSFGIRKLLIGLITSPIDFINGRREKEQFGFLYADMLIGFKVLGELLGFTWDQIEQAYYKKNKINHSRQENNY